MAENQRNMLTFAGASFRKLYDDEKDYLYVSRVMEVVRSCNHNDCIYAIMPSEGGAHRDGGPGLTM